MNNGKIIGMFVCGVLFLCSNITCGSLSDNYDASNSVRLFLGRNTDDLLLDIKILNIYFKNRTNLRWKKPSSNFLVCSINDAKKIKSILNVFWKNKTDNIVLNRDNLGVLQLEFILASSPKKLLFSGLISNGMFIISPYQDVDMPFDVSKPDVYVFLFKNNFLGSDMSGNEK